MTIHTKLDVYHHINGALRADSWMLLQRESRVHKTNSTSAKDTTSRVQQSPAVADGTVIRSAGIQT